MLEKLTREIAQLQGITEELKVNNQVSALEINAYLDELSEFLKEKIAPSLYEYGISLVNFYVNDINLPEEDLAVKKLKEALAKKAEMDIVGYSYTQERSFDTLEGAANGDKDPVKETNNNNSSKSTSTTTSAKETFGVKETAVFKDLKITANDLKESGGKEYFKPADGKVFIGVNFTIENTSN